MVSLENYQEVLSDSLSFQFIVSNRKYALHTTRFSEVYELLLNDSYLEISGLSELFEVFK